ncbi:MAG: hypothetical protein WA584_17615 [Pyrinomonadaceae bacterium]
MSNKTVLIITNQKEQEVDGVIDFLRTHNIDIIRWNLCQFPEKEFYTINSSSLLYPTLKVGVNPSLCWLHHFGQFSIEKSLIGLEREISLKETRSFVEGVMYSLGCNWYNEPLSIIHASNKVFQLQLAQRLEIPVPKYLITNDKEQVKKFVAEQKSVVIKSISTGFISYGEQNFKVYTRQFSELPEDLIFALKFSPIIIQQEIKKKREFRITVVEEQCFSVEVNHANLSSIIDVRELIREENRSYFKKATDIQDIERLSVKLTKELGLIYAGVDWVESEDGQYFFLELNPLGSFKWYEQCGNFDITSAIGNSLIRKIFNE